MGGQFYKEISKFGYFLRLEKSQNKVAITEEIGYGNYIVLSIIGQENKLRKKS